jgi:hypothetical protein
MGYLLLLNEATGIFLLGSPTGLGGPEEISFALAPFVGVAVVIGMYWLMNHERNITARFVFVTALSPLLLIATVVFAELTVSVFTTTLPSLFTPVILVVAFYVSAMVTLFLFFDLVPSKARNVIFLVYGSIIGSLTGAFLQSWLLLSVVLSLTLFDLILMKTKIATRAVEEIKDERGEWQNYSLVGKYVTVGLGDIVFYSMFPGHALVQSGVVAYCLSTVLLFIGISLNERLSQRHSSVPALVIPSLLALVPILLL